MSARKLDYPEHELELQLLEVEREPTDREKLLAAWRKLSTDVDQAIERIRRKRHLE